MFSWFTLASNPSIISLIPWPQDIHWQWVPRVNWLLYSFGGADLNLFPFPLQSTSLTFWLSMGMGQHLPRNGLRYFKSFQDYSCGSELHCALFCFGLAALEKARWCQWETCWNILFCQKENKNKHWNKRYKKYCRGCAELPPSLLHPVCPGHMVPPRPESPVIPIHSGEN